MTEDEWVYYAAQGVPHVISVTRLDPLLCKHLRTSTDLVQVRHDYVTKFVIKHRVSPHHLPMLENTIRAGRAIADRKHHLTLLHYDEVVFGRWFQASVKTVNFGSEIWVSTFHSLSHIDVARLCRKYPVVRAEKETGG